MTEQIPAEETSGFQPSVWLIYFSLVLVQIFIHQQLVEKPHELQRQLFHMEFLHGVQEFPFQYRILSFWQAEVLQRLGIGFEWSYTLARSVWLFISACLIHRFLRIFTSRLTATLGVTFLFALLPLTYVNIFMQESDAPNLAFYMLAYLCIFYRRDAYLMGLLPLAMLNRETPLLLPLLWLLYRWDELPWKQVALRMTSYLAIVFGVYSGLHLYYGYAPSPAEFWNLKTNAQDGYVYLFFFIWFCAFIDPVFRAWREKPKFLRRASLFIPFFLLFHWSIGLATETRYYLPIYPLIFALAFSRRNPGNSTASLEPAACHRWSRKTMVSFYGFLLIAFLAATTIFYIFIRRTHLEHVDPIRLARWHLKRGSLSARLGLYDRAGAEWQTGLDLDPANAELKYNLSQLHDFYQSELQRHSSKSPT